MVNCLAIFACILIGVSIMKGGHWSDTTGTDMRGSTAPHKPVIPTPRGVDATVTAVAVAVAVVAVGAAEEIDVATDQRFLWLLTTSAISLTTTSMDTNVASFVASTDGPIPVATVASLLLLRHH